MASTNHFNRYLISSSSSYLRHQSKINHITYSTTSNNVGPSTLPKEIPTNAPLRIPRQPIIRPGLIPAYDEAIAFLKQNSRELESKLSELQSKLKENPNDENLKKSITKIEIESQINDVNVRVRHKAGLGDMSKAVYRHLKEKDWREAGRLGRLMESVHRLRVFPDILPAMAPTADLRANFQNIPISVGTFISASKSITPPTIRVQVFHPEEELYTLMMIDPDVPDPSNQSFTSYLHWLVPNLPISAIQSKELTIDETNVTQLSYIPPHPARGSSLHRYTLLLFKQVSKLDSLPELNRLGFSARDWISSTEMQAVGVLSWTSKWREQEAKLISKIYEDHLKIPEPFYGRTPKPYSGHARLAPYTPLPLTHRHPPVIPWDKSVEDKKDV
ncbi:phosphatidylethanolamine-binding protein [Melampsora americana]|nr:phosphatidylethanolamine-binding protein [Melampsora americana]